MKLKSIIVVCDFIVRVMNKDLDLYKEREKFQQIPPSKELNEVFVDSLIQSGDLEVVEHVTELEAMTIPSYFTWHNIPTSKDMEDLRRAIGEDAWGTMTLRDRELFASGYQQTLFKEAEFTQATYFCWLGDGHVGTLEEKKMAIFRSWMEDKRKEAVNEQGFAVQNVFSNDPKDSWKMCSYTIGLTEKLGFDMVVVNGGKTSGLLLAEVASKCIAEGGFPVGPFTVSSYRVAGADLRVAIVDIPQGTGTTKMMLAAISKGMLATKQLYIGDKNNILPTEAGYDIGFIQAVNVEGEELTGWPLTNPTIH